MEPSYNDSFRSNSESNSGRDSDVVNSAQVGAGSDQIGAGSVPVSSVLPDSAPVNSVSANPTPIKSVPVNSVPVDSATMNSAPVSPVRVQASPGGTTFDSFQNPTMGGGFDFGSGFRQANTGMPISSGTGDIVLNNAPKKKVNKIVIVVLVVMIGLLALAGIIYVASNGFGNFGIANSGSLQGSFNEYVNYVILGKDSSEELNNEDIIATQPYFIGLSNKEREQYIQKANKKYGVFEEKYLKTEGEIDIESMKSFYQLYPGVSALSQDDIFKEYLENGKVSTERLIDATYSVSGANQYLGAYLDAEKVLAGLELQLIIEINEKRCVVNGEILDNCYTMTDDELQSFRLEKGRVMESYSELGAEALSTILSINDELNSGDVIEDGL
ncbi:hypothetical protein IJH72_00075 [Candidatus Saccharibacteria bacterium]|nr:hypothetical protein [Candidatus Saccharibacteria bacterium]